MTTGTSTATLAGTKVSHEPVTSKLHYSDYAPVQYRTAHRPVDFRRERFASGSARI